MAGLDSVRRLQGYVVGVGIDIYRFDCEGGGMGGFRCTEVYIWANVYDKRLQHLVWFCNRMVFALVVRCCCVG